jgi:hypothetical protein
MADPTGYRISYSFGGYQASNPTRPLPAPQVDNEFENIEIAIAQLVAAVKNVRRADGKLQNNLVTFDSLANEIRLLFNDGAVDNATLLAAAVASASASATSAQASADAAAAASGLDPALVLAGAALDSETVFASASTTNIGGSATTRVRIDGTATINSLGVVSKRLRIVRYNGVLQIAHNAVSQVLIGGASRTVAVGDQSLFMSDADGNWRELLYSKADGSPLAIVDRSITYAKLQNASGVGVILGRKTAGSGIFEECTFSDILDMVTGVAQGDLLFRGAAGWKRLGAGAAGQYIKSNGAGADLSYQTLFGQLLHVREEQATNTNTASNLTGSTWSQCVLNTVKTNEIVGASLGSNQITLPAGTYYATISVPINFVVAGAVLYFKSRLRNLTAGATVVFTPTTGQNGTTAAAAVNPIQSASARFTLSATSVLEFQHWQNRGTGAFLGGAVTSGYGEPEIYADVQIVKVA